MQRFAVAVEYCGTGFSGWQAQPHAVSVQAEVETALSKVANHPVATVCAGRTDAGVHAIQQVVHFDTTSVRKNESWLRGGNANLCAGISLRWVKEVDAGFSARFSAVARSYRYVILNRRARPAIFNKHVSWLDRPLKHDLMHEAGQLLLGENDFNAFRSSACQAQHAMRELQSIAVSREGDYVYIDIRANAFLHNMVRIIVGTLCEVGWQKKPIDWIADVLASKDRAKGGNTAAPDGLYFVTPYYPSDCGIPTNTEVPQFFAERQ